MPSDIQPSAANKPGVTLGWILLALAVVPQAVWLVRGYDQVHDIELAIWGFYLSGLLWASYKYESRSFLFRGIMRLFRNVHVPRGAWLAPVYSVAFALLGARYVWLSIRNGI